MVELGRCVRMRSNLIGHPLFHGVSVGTNDCSLTVRTNAKGKSGENRRETGEFVREGCWGLLQNQRDGLLTLRHGVQGVEGSNPFAPTIIKYLASPIRGGVQEIVGCPISLAHVA